MLNIDNLKNGFLKIVCNIYKENKINKIDLYPHLCWTTHQHNKFYCFKFKTHVFIYIIIIGYAYEFERAY